MNILILIIVAPLLYMIVGTISGILLTILETDSLKLKIILLVFLRAIIYSYFLSLLLPSLFDDRWIWFCGFVVAVVLKEIIFSNQKFLLSLTNHNDSISIEYIDTFLRTKSIEVRLDNVRELKLSDMKSILDYPASLKIGDSDNPQRFIVLSKKIWGSANEFSFGSERKAPNVACNGNKS